MNTQCMPFISYCSYHKPLLQKLALVRWLIVTCNMQKNAWNIYLLFYFIIFFLRYIFTGKDVITSRICTVVDRTCNLFLYRKWGSRRLFATFVSTHQTMSSVLLQRQPCAVVFGRCLFETFVSTHQTTSSVLLQRQPCAVVFGRCLFATFVSTHQTTSSVLLQRQPCTVVFGRCLFRILAWSLAIRLPV
jgi:TRAP-type C4-dicarboxylate transport system permease large subunit